MMGLFYLWPAALLWILWLVLGWDVILVFAGAATGVGLLLAHITS